MPVEQLPPELDRTWAYTTADPVRPDLLGLATLDGRYSFQPSAACHSSVWSVADGQEVMLYVVAGRDDSASYSGRLLTQWHGQPPPLAPEGSIRVR